MFSFEGIDENLKFLVLELKKQVEDTQTSLIDPENFSTEPVLYREDYIDYLTNNIAKKSHKLIISLPHQNKTLINQITMLNAIAKNLEKIGDFLENIVRQTSYFKNDKFISTSFSVGDYVDLIVAALIKIDKSFLNEDIQMAKEICQAEATLDELYFRDFNAIKQSLEENGQNTGDLLTSLFIFRYFERIGDAFLNIGEAIISSVIGTKIKISQYIAMVESLDSEDDDFIIENVGGDTRSGCRIDKLKNRPNATNNFETIFKEGKKKKLYQEKIKMEQWAKLVPGLAPKVLGYEEKGDNASLLTEFLYGKNFQEILLGPNSTLLNQALSDLLYNIENIWTQTKRNECKSAQFIQQLQKRLNDVYQLHPYFNEKPLQIGSLKPPQLEKLLEKAALFEQMVPPPFTVLIHGDFNNDNIIYNEENRQVHYIDLHRSKHTDYIQDVAIFLASNFRMPIFDNLTRQRINQVSLQFYRFIERFARKNNDSSFALRLSLGLIRSLITSTRFSLERKFAKAMFLRAVYLLEKVVAHQGKAPEDYYFDTNLIIY